jgi:hypothetical protein
MMIMSLLFWKQSASLVLYDHKENVPDPELDSSKNLKGRTEESPLNRQYWAERKKYF